MSASHLFPTGVSPSSDPSSHDSRSGGGPSEAQAAKSNSSTRIRRRNRMITSCLECRRRKLKCDRLHPCSNCSRAKRDCVFLAPSLDSAARLKLTELKNRIGSLERSLEEDVAAKHSAEVLGNDSEVTLNAAAPAPNVYIPDDEKRLEPTRMAVMDAVYEDEADDDMVDLGFQLGKMRMTDRVGGFFRPRIADEIAVSLDEKGFSDGKLNNSLAIPAALHELSAQSSSTSFLDPGPNFIAPRSDMLLGCIARDHTLLDFLPTQAAADKLMEQYWDACHPVARIVHRPSFERRYQLFWENIAQGLEPTPSIQAIVFAVFFTAVVSMPEQDVLNGFGVAQRGLIENFQLGTETALGSAHFLRTTKTETLQAFVMYLIPMCRDTISRAHSALVGAAIRLGECMGLHRDPAEYNHGPVETHVRRLIWYQLCFLDLRTAETQGPRPSIRREDYSTRFPLNVNDADLATEHVDDTQGWTDMTFPRIRFECQEMIRVVFTDRIRLEKKSISITHALGKIESFRKAMYARYGHIFSEPHQIPLQRAAAVTMSLLIHRLHIALLHRYHMSVTERIPDRLRQVLLSTGTQQLDDAVELETAPDLQRWHWYSRAYHNYHTAFLLLLEVYYHPMRRDADRIWRCLDYVYETNSAPLQRDITRRELVQHRERKAAMIMAQLRDRMNVYRAMRRMKYPSTMADARLPGFYPLNPVEPVTKRNAASSPVAQQSSTEMGDADETPARKLDAKIAKASTHMMFSNFLPGIDAQSRIRQIRTGQAETPAYEIYNFPSIYQTVQPIQPTSILDSMSRAGRGPSLDPEGTYSTDSEGLFMPGAPDASAGTAPQGSLGVSPNAEDLPMLDIDWTEWDKLFPPHINDGNINLPPQSLYGTLPTDPVGFSSDSQPDDPSRYTATSQPSL